MDDRTKILKLLGDGPEDAGELSRKLGIARSTLFSLLMKMENEHLIMWNGRQWAITQPSDPKRKDPEPSRPADDQTADHP